MNKGNNTIIAIEGHDGVGKTSLCNTLAEKMNARIVRPFAGNTGNLILQLSREKHFDRLIEAASGSIQNHYNRHEGELLIFDRHWITVFTLIPEPYRKKWTDFPLTVLLYADPATVKKRLDTRNEDPLPDEYHRYYLRQYLEIAHSHSCLCLDTARLPVDELAEKVIAYLGKKQGE